MDYWSVKDMWTPLFSDWRKRRDSLAAQRKKKSDEKIKA